MFRACDQFRSKNELIKYAGIFGFCLHAATAATDDTLSWAPAAHTSRARMMRERLLANGYTPMENGMTASNSLTSSLGCNTGSSACILVFTRTCQTVCRPSRLACTRLTWVFMCLSQSWRVFSTYFRTRSGSEQGRLIVRRSGISPRLQQ